MKEVEIHIEVHKDYDDHDDPSVVFHRVFGFDIFEFYVLNPGCYDLNMVNGVTTYWLKIFE